MRKQNKRSAVGSVLEAQLRAELLPFDFSTMSATRVPAALVSVDCTDSLPETTEAVDKAQPPAARDENDTPQEVYRVCYLPMQLVFRDSWFRATPNNVHLFAHSLGRTDVGTCRQISLECKITLRIIKITCLIARILLYLKVAPNCHASCAAGLRRRPRGHPDDVRVVQRVEAWERASIAAERAHQAEGTDPTERGVRRKVPPLCTDLYASYLRYSLLFASFLLFYLNKFPHDKSNVL